MDYFETGPKLEETLVNKLVDNDLAEAFISKIGKISDRYDLTLGELGEIYGLVNKIIEKKIREDEFLEELFEKLGVKEEEKEEIAVWLEETLEEIKGMETTLVNLKLAKEELAKRSNSNN